MSVHARIGSLRQLIVGSIALLAATANFGWASAPIPRVSPSVGPGEPFALRSVSFPLIGSTYLDDIEGWVSVADAIAQMKALGANDVRVSVTAAGYNNSTDNFPDPAYTAELRPSSDKLLALFQAIKAAGMHLTVMPQPNIRFDPNGNLLDGIYVRPTNFQAWKDAYALYFNDIASLAQQAGAERIVMFSDFEQVTAQDPANTSAWLGLFASTRQVFSGELTALIFSDGKVFPEGNTNVDLIARDIIDALDIIGIGWFPQPLTNGVDDPTMDQLLTAWRSNAASPPVDSVAFLKGVSDKYGKPVWVIDVAFHSFSGDNYRSNDIFNATIPLVESQQEQANLFDSFFEVMSKGKGDWLLGVSPQNWNRFPLGYDQTARFLNSPVGENFRGKLAEKVISEWYNNRRQGGPTQTYPVALTVEGGGTVSFNVGGQSGLQGSVKAAPICVWPATA